MKTLSEINFGKPRSRRRRRVERPQINIVVVRFDKQRATWGVKIIEPYGPNRMSVFLPGEFKLRWRAKDIAEALANHYRESGYNVALDTSGKHS